MRRFQGQGFKGMNDAYDPSMIADDEFQDSLNMRCLKDKSMTKRQGFYKTLTGNGDTPTQVFQSKSSAGYVDFYSTKDKLITAGVGTSLTGLKGTTSGQFLRFNDRLFFANGVDEIKKCGVEQNIVTTLIDGAGQRVIQTNGLGEIVFSLTLGFTPVRICNNSTYYFILDSSSNIKQYDKTFALVASISLATTGLSVIRDIACNSTSLYICGNIGNDGKIQLRSAMGDLGLRNTATNIGIFNYAVCCNEDVIWIAQTAYNNPTATSIYNYNAALTVGAVLGTGSVDGVVFDSNTRMANIPGNSYIPYTTLPNNMLVFINTATASSIKLVNLIPFVGFVVTSITSPTIPTPFTPTGISTTGLNNVGITATMPGGYTYINYGLYNGTTLVFRYGQNLSQIATADISNSLTGPYDSTNWTDLCTPNRPTQLETSTAGNITTGTVLLYRCTGYNSISGIETSGGAISAPQTSTGKVNEITFDMNPATMWTKTKCDQIGVNQWKIYRSVNGGNFYNATSDVYTPDSGWQIYIDPEVSVNSTDTYMLLTGGVHFPMITDYIDEVYVKWDNEIIGIPRGDGRWYFRGNITLMNRGQKGTIATAHDITSPIYLYSVVYAANVTGSICPTENGYVDNAKYIISYKGRFVMANSTSNPSRMWWSSFGINGPDEDIINEFNFLDVEAATGDPITGLAVYQGLLFIFKRNSTWYFTGDLPDSNTTIVPNAGLDRLNDHIGCESQNTIIEYENRLYWMSQIGIMCYFGNMIHNLSESKIPKLWRTINFRQSYLSCCGLNPVYNEIWWSVPTGTNLTCNKVIVLNMFHSDLQNNGNNSFYTFDRTISAMRWVEQDSTIATTSGYLFSGQFDGEIGREDEPLLYADNGTSISSYVKTKNYNLGYDIWKRFHRLFIDHTFTTAYTSTVSYKSDSMAAESTGVTFTGLGTGVREYARIRTIDSGNLSPQGHYAYFKLTNNNSQQWVLFNIMIDFEEGRIR